MATVLQPVAAPLTSSASGPAFGADVPIELFEVPKSRTVHGNVFPLGIRVKEGHQFQNIDTAVRHIEDMAQTGLFDGLLQSRE